MVKGKYKGLVGLFPGVEIFSLQMTKVDQNSKAKKGIFVLTDALTALTTKKLVVNELKERKLEGDITVLSVNGGGSNGVDFGVNETLGLGEDFKALEAKEENKKRFTANMEEAVNIANAHNRSEINRVNEVIEDLKKQKDFLQGVIDANATALKVWLSENED